MNLQILELVIWPRKRSLPPNRIPFAPGVANVISGSSKTGKSAVIPIIDYCLASESCQIPTGVIRDACAWFGVLVQTDEGKKLFARREPDAQRSTNQMFMLEGEDVRVPEFIESSNTTTVHAKEVLNRLAGLSNLPLGDAARSGYEARPSFRDLMAFCFQPQNIVANPNALFYKADSHDHRQKLRNLFPYVLGAVTPEVLALRLQLSELRLLLQRRERELERLTAVSVEWEENLRAWITQAAEYGLVRKEAAGRPSVDLVAIAHEIAAKAPEDSKVTGDTVEAAVTELQEVFEEEREISRELLRLRNRYSAMMRLREGANEYAQGLEHQVSRLALSDWLRGIVTSDVQCPVCASSLAEGVREVDQLVEVLREIENATTGNQEQPIPATFEKEFIDVRRRIDSLAERLSAIRSRRAALEARPEEERSVRYRLQDIGRFLGRLDYALHTFEETQGHGELAEEVGAIRERYKELSDQIAEARIRKRLENAKRMVETIIAKIIPNLDVEWPSAPVALLLEDLSVAVIKETRRDYLWEIGSGANWVAYHVATSLALQEYFLSIEANPVPSFLVFDQPSQVYFPRKLAGRDAESDEPPLRDEDVAAVRAIFQEVGKSCSRSKGKLQAIILDHAGPDVWSGLPAVHLVQEWRNGMKLVPEAWI